MSSWPDEFYDFAFFPEPDKQLELLSREVEEEDWTYQHADSEHPYPVLFNYIRFTYKRVAEESKIALSDDGQYACFNSGLVTPNQEPVYASFEVNRHEEAQPWFFKAWFRRGRWELNRFPELPDLAHYFDDPSCLVFDTPGSVKRISPGIRKSSINHKDIGNMGLFSSSPTR